MASHYGGSRVRLAALSLVLVLGGLASLPAATAQTDEEWPLWGADWAVEMIKDVDAVPPPHEPEDLAWFHLHRNHPTLPDALTNTIAPIITRGTEQRDPAGTGIEIRYLVHGIPVSGWLGAPFRFELDIDNPALAQLPDGIHDLSFDARGASRSEYKPLPGFVHLSRDLANGEPFGFDKSVPIINIMQENPTDDGHFGPGVVYVDPAERNWRGYPLDPSTSPWQTPPHETDLYQEQMAPHSELFRAAQMWWDHPAHEDSPFVRGMTPKHGEDHRTLREDFRHERFPMKDGPRGIGWMSPYVSGQVDSQGRFAFAETGGRIGYLMPDGEVITLAGWRVKEGEDPIWWGKPTAQVRNNMENRGTWTSGGGEFRTPLDVAVDPADESILYVASYEDHVIWKVEVPANPKTQDAIVSVFAGDPGHASGFADGNGTAARFNGPASLVFDPVADVLYVADQDNDSIRQISRNGDVTTVAGSPGMQQRVTDAGLEWTDQLASRTVGQFEVSSAQAAAGVTADVYLPQSIRVDSTGRIVFLDIGFGAIRQLDPTTGETVKLGEVLQKHRQFDRGWAWLDVDRFGNSGPKDGIYWTKFVSTIEGEHFNEVYRWLPPGGGESFNLFPTKGTGLYPDGWGRREATNPPHYGWLVAVDPRGGVLLGGGGEHGLTRLRPQQPDDPVETRDYWLGRAVFTKGSPLIPGSYTSPTNASESMALKYGWNGHNYLGLTDAWGLRGASDEELLDAFETPDVVRTDETATRQLLEYLRPNTLGSTNDPVDPPVGGGDGLELLESTCSLSVWTGTVEAGDPDIDVDVVGQCDLPANTSAVMVSIWPENPAATSNLRLGIGGVDPTGVVNFGANGLNNSTSMMVPVSGEGELRVGVNPANFANGTILADGVTLEIIGWSADDGSLGYTPLNPCAFFDSRPGFGTSSPGPLAVGASISADLAGTFDAGQGGGQIDCGVPDSASAALVNVVAIQPTGGEIEVGSADTGAMLVTNAPLSSGFNNASAVAVPLDASGGVNVDLVGDAGVTVHLRMSVLGYFGTSTGLQFNPVEPCVVFDSRSGGGSLAGPRSGDQTSSYQITGSLSPNQGGESDCGVPEGAEAVEINLVAARALRGGNLRASASGTAPLGGVLNFARLDPGMNNSNAVVIPLSSDGRMDVFANGGSSGVGLELADVRGTVTGYYTSG